jgi:GNAT superfamily N-acetyltransferase
MTDTTIRPAVPTDAMLISEMAAATWRVCYKSILPVDQIDFMLRKLYEPALLSELISSGSQPFYIALSQEVPCGFASYSQIDEATAKLNKLYVLQDMHGSGIGGMLLSEIESRSRELGYSSLLLNVNRYNPALHFYLHHGFSIDHEEDIPIGPYWMNDYIMRKSLS